MRVPNGDAANGARRPHLGIAALGDGALDDELGALARPSANATSRATPAPRAIRSHGIELRADRGRLRGARLSRGGTGLNLALHDGFDLGWIPAARSAEVRLLDPIAARAVGAAGESGLLVRPDGKPAAVLPGVGAPAVSLGHQVGAVAA